MVSLAAAFGSLEAALRADSALASTVKGVLQFELGSHVWVIDCSGSGRVAEGKAVKPDCTITMAEKDFLDLFAGTLNGMSAYMAGKMKVCMQLATWCWLFQMLTISPTEDFTPHHLPRTELIRPFASVDQRQHGHGTKVGWADGGGEEASGWRS